MLFACDIVIKVELVNMTHVDQFIFHIYVTELKIHHLYSLITTHDDTTAAWS